MHLTRTTATGAILANKVFFVQLATFKYIKQQQQKECKTPFQSAFSQNNFRLHVSVSLKTRENSETFIFCASLKINAKSVFNVCFFSSPRLFDDSQTFGLFTIFTNLNGFTLISNAGKFGFWKWRELNSMSPLLLLLYLDLLTFFIFLSFACTPAVNFELLDGNASPKEQKGKVDNFSYDTTVEC